MCWGVRPAASPPTNFTNLLWSRSTSETDLITNITSLHQIVRKSLKSCLSSVQMTESMQFEKRKKTFEIQCRTKNDNISHILSNSWILCIPFVAEVIKSDVLRAHFSLPRIFNSWQISQEHKNTCKESRVFDPYQSSLDSIFILEKKSKLR